MNRVRILIGIDVDKYIARAAQHRELFVGAEEEVKEDCLRQIKDWHLSRNGVRRKREDGKGKIL